MLSDLRQMKTEQAPEAGSQHSGQRFSIWSLSLNINTRNGYTPTRHRKWIYLYFAGG